MYTYGVKDKISANVKGWAKFESKQIQERLRDYKGFRVRRKRWALSDFPGNVKIIPFCPLKIIWISKKQNASGGIRTREGSTEGLDGLHYAIKSLGTAESN